MASPLKTDHIVRQNGSLERDRHMIVSVATGPDVGTGMAGLQQLRAAQEDAALNGLVHLGYTNPLWDIFP